MKIIVLMGSPNRKGSTSILVENFVKGAEEAGHSVEVIDVCHANIHPCTGCVRCGYEGPCVQKDDVETIRKKLLNTSLLLRHVGAAQNSCGPLLRLQQQPEQQAPEIGATDSGVEFGRLDIRRARSAL